MRPSTDIQSVTPTVITDIPTKPGTLVRPTTTAPTMTPREIRTARRAAKTKATVTAKTERTEILAVLTRAAGDPGYIAQLTYDPSGALQDYDLTQPARAAIASGDIRWIEGRVGRLDAHARTWLDCRLQQEIW